MSLLVAAEQVLDARAGGDQPGRAALSHRRRRARGFRRAPACASAKRPVAASAVALAESSSTRSIGGSGLRQQAQRAGEPSRRRRRRALGGLPAGLGERGHGGRVADLGGGVDVLGASQRAGAAVGEAPGRRARARRCARRPARPRRRRAGRSDGGSRKRRGTLVGRIRSAREQLVDGLHRLRLADAGRGGGQLGLERVAGDRRALQHPPAAGGQQRELLAQGGHDHRRHLQLGDRHRRPRARPEPRRRRRGPAAPGRTGCRRTPRTAAAAAASERLAAEHRGGLLAGQRVELDARQLRRRAAPARVALRSRGDGWWGRDAEHDQHAGGGRPVQQAGREVDGRGVGPVEVVEDEHQRLGGRQPFEQLADRPVGPVALVLERRGDRRGRGPTATGRPARARPARLRRGSPAVAARRRSRYSSSASTKTQNGEVAFEVGARSAQDDVPAGVGARGELGQQPRLADAGRADDLDRAGRPGGQLIERVVEPRSSSWRPTSESVTA